MERYLIALEFVFLLFENMFIKKWAFRPISSIRPIFFWSPWIIGYLMNLSINKICGSYILVLF